MTDHETAESELLTLSFSLHANPGAYALLLGAGVSAPSGIPTAWGVLEDLVSRAAELSAESMPDPIVWYQDRYGEPPTYEGVLERIAPTQIERQRVLRGYFEQSPQDIDSGNKNPTAAHHAIAKLVRSGSVKVIVTLNFDHLIENAIRAEGIEPTVIATPADIEGMAPLHTIDCCVIHLHGDYLDPTSMLNTVAELEAYHPSTERLLARILEDYGLIIAGWSAKYDPALRASIASNYPRRFSLTWFEPAQPTEEASKLRILKQGIHISQDANTGFGRLADSVTALRTRRARHPLTIPVAVETAKRELSGRAVAIGVHDSLLKELDALHRLPEFHLADYHAEYDYETMLGRVEEATRLSAALLATLTYWGDETTDRWWLDEISRFSSPVDGSGYSKLLSLKLVSGNILFYSVGVAAVASKRFDLLAQLFALKRRRLHLGNYEDLAGGLDATSGYDQAKNVHTRVFDLVSPLVSDSLSLGDESIDEAWQLLEILRLAWTALRHADFAVLRAEYSDKNNAFEGAKAAFEKAERRVDSDASQERVARADAWQQRDRVLGQIGRLFHTGRPHIRTVDDRVEERYRSVVTDRLKDDLATERDSHPLIISGFFDDILDALVALEAVSTALGRVGREQSWERVRGSFGEIPMQMWLDTGQTPKERRDRA